MLADFRSAGGSENVLVDSFSYIQYIYIYHQDFIWGFERWMMFRSDLENGEVSPGGCERPTAAMPQRRTAANRWNALDISSRLRPRRCECDIRQGVP